MQGDIDERAVIEDTRGIDHLLTPSIGSFAYRHLPLVDVSDDIVGDRSLGDASIIGFRVPVIDLAHLSVGVKGSREMAKSDEHSVVVGVVGADDRAVGRGFLTDDEVGTGLCCRCGEHDQDGCK